MKNVIGYTLNRADERSYRTLFVNIITEDYFDSSPIQFHYQAGGPTELAGWYAFSVSVKTGRTYAMKEAYAILSRILAKFPDVAEPLPEQLIAALDSLKIQRVIRDPRVYGWVKFSDLLHPSVSRYVDDYRKMGRSSCTYSVVAHNEECAKKLIRAQAAEKSAEEVIAFMNADEPGMIADEGRAYTDLPEMLDHSKNVSTASSASTEYSFA